MSQLGSFTVPAKAHVSTLMILFDPDRLMCRLKLTLILTPTYEQIRVNHLRQSRHMRRSGSTNFDSVNARAITGSVKEPGWLMCWLCRLKLTPDRLICQLSRVWLTLIGSYADSVECNWPWLAHMLVLLTVMDLDCSCVNSVDCDESGSAQVSTLSTVIDPDSFLSNQDQLRSTYTTY